MESEKVGFSITDGKGFKIKFANGFTVSVQFGPRNYCANYPKNTMEEPRIAGENGSPNAEVAWWGPDGNFIPFENNDDVKGYQSPEEVLQLLSKAAKAKAEGGQ